MPILSSVLVLKGFSWPRVSESTWGTSRVVCGTLGMSPRLIPPLDRKILYKLASLKYCYTTVGIEPKVLNIHTLEMDERESDLKANTSFIGWMALVGFITFFVQKMASLVEAVHFKLSGMLSSWLREDIKCNIFFQPCNFEKIVRIMPQVTCRSL